MKTSVPGGFETAPGREFGSRYRPIVHDGPPDPKLIERLRDDFAVLSTARIVSPEG